MLSPKFSTLLKTNFNFSVKFILSSAISFNLNKSKNLSFGRFNSLQNNKILHQSKLKTFADDKLNVTQMIITVFDRVENIVGKGEVVCTSKFSFSNYVFKRLLSQTRQKVSLCGNGLN